MSRAAAVELTALEHLRELWLRLVGSVVVMFVGGGIAYVFRLQIINFLQRPLGEKLYYTSPTGSFQFIMQVCLLCGVVLALPIIIYNLLRYVEPVFAKGFSRRFVLLVLSSSLALTLGGVLFAYYLTLPIALHFFNTVGTSTLHPLISVNQYFSFIMGYLATFAVVFQLPLLLLFINHIRPFPPGGLTKWRKHIYIGSFAISLIMPSSPDPLSQISLAIPIVSLYELSVVLIWGVNRKKRRVIARNQRVSTERERRNAGFAQHASQGRPALTNNLDVLGEADESFSIARMQEKMRNRTQLQSQNAPIVSQASASNAISSLRKVPRTNYQQPIKRATLYERANRLSQAEPRMINDML